MKKLRLLGAVCACVLAFITTTTNAAILPLEGRLPETSGGIDYLAYYDPNLDITWTANADITGTKQYQETAPNGVVLICAECTIVAGSTYS